MQTRRDQLQAYRFVTRRVMAALLHGEPDTPESPMRKLVVATFSGVMVAVLAVAAFGVWGLLKPGGGAQSIEDPGTLLIEKETGTRYVFNQQDHMLHPMLNYTSARLYLNSDTITERTVSRESLSRYRRGVTLGIPGAPESLPDAGSLVSRPWSVCSRMERSASGTPRSTVTLLAGRDPGGTGIGQNEAVVVRAGVDQYWVIWHNQRLLADQTTIKVFTVAQEPPVGPAWLNSLPAGPDFKPPHLAGLGDPASFQLNGVTPLVGQVFTADIVSGGKKYYVALTDGLAPVWETEVALMFGDPSTRTAYPGKNPTAIPVDPASANTHLSPTSVSNSALPHTLPTPATLSDGDSTTLCATYPDPKNKPNQIRVTQVGNIPTLSDRNSGAVGTATDTGSVDQVILPPGEGALVGLVPGPDQLDRVQTYYLVTEQGQRFPFRSPELVARLGYDTGSAVPLQSNLLGLIPDGPILDTGAAGTPVQIVPRQAPATSPSTG